MSCVSHTTPRSVLSRGTRTPGVRERLRAIEKVVLSMTRVTGSSAALPPQEGSPVRAPSGQACRLWNDSRCTFSHCQNAHICISCGGPGGTQSWPAWVQSLNQLHTEAPLRPPSTHRQGHPLTYVRASGPQRVAAPQASERGSDLNYISLTYHHARCTLCIYGWCERFVLCM